MREPAPFSIPLHLKADLPVSTGAWLCQRRVYPAQDCADGAAADAQYARLCGRVLSFKVLPGGRRSGTLLGLELGRGSLSWDLQGRVVLQEPSADRGRRRERLRGHFGLPGAWRLDLDLWACQELISGAVSLEVESSLLPGEGRSMRHLMAARGLRWQLNRELERAWGGSPCA